MDSDQQAGQRGLHGISKRSRAGEYPRALAPSPGTGPRLRGISIAGLEFGTEKPGFCNEAPGKLRRDYFLCRSSTLERLSDLGYKTFRIPFSWERIQPILGGPLDPDGVQQLRFLVGQAQKFGAGLLLDLHNYGRYTMRLDQRIVTCAFEEEIDGRVHVGADDLADFWARMAHALSGLPGVVGYALMNEPHDLPPGAWLRASRAAVDAIRTEGDRTRVYVAGEDWSHSSNWGQVNPASPWIEDPQDRVIYEAHCYLDQNGSGKYVLPYEEELAFDPHLEHRGISRLQPFLEWLRESGAEGVIGEFAVPCADRQWTALLPGMLQALDQAEVQAIWWAAGEYWGNYPLSLQPGRLGDPPQLAEIALLRE